MGDGTGKQTVGASPQQETALAEVGLPLEELVRRGAREIIQRAIEAEVRLLLEQYDDVRLLDGRRAVVRNGTLPEREILAGSAEGAVERGVSGLEPALAGGERIRLLVGGRHLHHAARSNRRVGARVCAREP